MRVWRAALRVIPVGTSGSAARGERNFRAFCCVAGVAGDAVCIVPRTSVPRLAVSAKSSRALVHVIAHHAPPDVVSTTRPGSSGPSAPLRRSFLPILVAIHPLITMPRRHRTLRLDQERVSLEPFWRGMLARPEGRHHNPLPCVVERGPAVGGGPSGAWNRPSLVQFTRDVRRLGQTRESTCGHQGPPKATVGSRKPAKVQGWS